jgi:hypothetical protein
MSLALPPGQFRPDCAAGKCASNVFVRVLLVRPPFASPLCVRSLFAGALLARSYTNPHKERLVGGRKVA